MPFPQSSKPPQTPHDSYAGFTALEITLIACGALLLLAFLFLMRDILTPPIVAGAGIILLWPVRRQKTAQAIMFAGGFLLALWFLHKLSTILVPFATIYLVAYLFDPLVGYLQRRHRIPRTLSSLMVTLMLVSMVGMLVVLLVPHLISEVDALGTRALDSIELFRHWLLTSPVIDRLTVAGIEKEQLINETMLSIQNFLNYWTSRIPATIEGLLNSVTSIIGFLTVAVVTPVILFYTLKDYRLIKTGIKYLFPTIGGQQDYLNHIGNIVGKYLRGQLTISAITAITVSIALMLGKIPFALLIGIVAGLLNLIPSLGAILTNMIGIFIALAFGERGFADVVIVMTVLLGQGLLEQAVLVPKILSQHVGLHPVVILLSLFIFGYFFGFIGLFVAVPVMALIITAFKTIRREVSLDLSPYFSFSGIIPPPYNPAPESLFRHNRYPTDSDSQSGKSGPAVPSSETPVQNPEDSTDVTFAPEGIRKDSKEETLNT